MTSQATVDTSGRRFCTSPLPNLEQWAQTLIDRENLLTDREEILRAIAFHESRVLVLRANLPNVVKQFYRFRCKPEQNVWVYAATREQADQRLRDRMDKAYGANGWRIASTVVDVYSNPDDAAANTPSNLFRSLTIAEGKECLADYQANKRGRSDKPKLPNVGKSRLELDAEGYEKYLRLIDK